MKTLLTKQDGIHRPQSLTINHSRDKIIVTNSPPYKSDFIQLFDLEYVEVNGVDEKKAKKSSTCTIT